MILEIDHHLKCDFVVGSSYLHGWKTVLNWWALEVRRERLSGHGQPVADMPREAPLRARQPSAQLREEQLRAYGLQKGSHAHSTSSFVSRPEHLLVSLIKCNNFID
jgi:hypothetical protein